jgi:hypothetical protein
LYDKKERGVRLGLIERTALGAGEETQTTEAAQATEESEQMRRRRNSMHKTPHSDPNVEWLVNETRDKIPHESEHSQLASGSVHEHKIALKLRTTPITWGIPMDEMMYSKFFNNFMHLNMMPWDSVITTESTYLPDARNYIHEIFVTKFKTDFLFMLDSDVMPPPGVAENLIQHDLPIVGGVYHKKEVFEIKNLDGVSRFVSRPVVYDWVEEKDGKYWFSCRIEDGEGLEKVAGIGAGCLMIRRDLAERLGPRPYDMTAGGEDLVLCKKIMDLGVDLHVDWSIKCAHVGVGSY